MYRYILSVLMGFSLFTASFTQVVTQAPAVTTTAPGVVSSTVAPADTTLPPAALSSTVFPSETTLPPTALSSTVSPSVTTLPPAALSSTVSPSETTLPPAALSSTVSPSETTLPPPALSSTVSPAVPTANLMCIECDSNTNPDCKWTQDANSAKICRKQTTSGLPQCYTQTLNKVVYRGCVSDRNSDLGVCSDITKCMTCNEVNGCNNKAEFTCIKCDSAANSICRTYPTTYKGTYCTNAVNQSTAACYEASYDNVYYRGCLVDAVEQIRQICTNDVNNDCQTCTTSNCNVDVTNAAWQNTASGIIVIAALFLMTQ